MPPHGLSGPTNHNFPPCANHPHPLNQKKKKKELSARLKCTAPQEGKNGPTYFLSLAASPKGVVCLLFRSELWRGTASRGSELSSVFVGATPQVRVCLLRADSVFVRRKMC